MPIELPPGTANYSDRNPPPQSRQILVILGIVAMVIAIAFWLLNLLVSGLILLIPPSFERQLGALTVPAFEQLAQPSATQDTLNQLLDRLEVHLPASQQQAHQYQVLYIPDKTVNALAIPGDRVIIYDGLLDQMNSENELMMVLGHELGHFAHRDHLRRLGRSLVVRLMVTVVFGDPGALQSIAVSSINAITDSQFSQNQEYQADTFGLNLLHATYGHVGGATEFFQKMSKQERHSVDFLSTHPTSRNRIKRLEAEIRTQGFKLGTRSPLPDALISTQR
jgi:Zn-dependent protease with chaperone function